MSFKDIAPQKIYVLLGDEYELVGFDPRTPCCLPQSYRYTGPQSSEDKIVMLKDVHKFITPADPNRQDFDIYLDNGWDRASLYKTKVVEFKIRFSGEQLSDDVIDAFKSEFNKVVKDERFMDKFNIKGIYFNVMEQSYDEGKL